MRVAVCIGGIVRGEAEKNIELMRNVFPYDFYFSTWNTVKCSIVLDNFKVYDEPRTLDLDEVNHPNKKIREKLRHRHKQILAHAYMLKDLPLEYDMIIRARYDIKVYPNDSWLEFLNASYTNKIPIGFSRRPTSRVSKEFTEKIYGTKKGSTPEKLGGGLNDLIIFHPRNLFNSEKVLELYDNRELKVAEHGWWQVLVKEHFSPKSYQDDPCINLEGCITLDTT